MTVDDAGLFWITNFWLAVGFLLIAVGLTLFSHGWIVTGRPPRPRQMAIRMRRPRPRATHLGAHPRAVARPALLVGGRNVKATPPQREAARERRLVA